MLKRAPQCALLADIHDDFREIVFDACPRCQKTGVDCMADLVTRDVQDGAVKDNSAFHVEGEQ